MKNIFLFTLLAVATATINAQSVKGSLTLNGKTKTELELENSSAVNLFKEFKTGKYQLKFSFDGKGISVNRYKERIVFFEFITKVKKDGELVKNVIRKQPIPYFPGDMFIPAEAFDFVSVLASSSMSRNKKKQMIGIMPEGKYTVELLAKPVGYKGSIEPVIFHFTVK